MTTTPSFASLAGAPKYEVTLLRTANFKLDAGSMFGLIPKVVWSRSVATDDKNRMELQHNCLLLRRVDGGSTPNLPNGARAPRTILIETGTGNKLDDKMQGVFALEKRWVGDALSEAGVRAEDIDAVIVSHMHFDHGGGLTRLPRSGETPEWSGDDGGGGSSRAGGVMRSFPNAKVYIQAREWQDALANQSVMTKTYYRDHLLPFAPGNIGAKQLQLVDSPLPFAPGLVPGRDDAPAIPIAARLTELWPGGGIFVFRVPGHTWGQQAVLFRDTHSRTVVFTPDVMPTVHHAKGGAAYSLGYDAEPYTSMIVRRWLLADAAEHGWVLCLDHEHGNPFIRVAPDGTIEPAPANP